MAFTAKSTPRIAEMTVMTQQQKSAEWHDQWSLFQDSERFLFDEWIAPKTLDDFRDKDVLECGCGGGQHTAMVAAVARSVTAVDLNTVDIARTRNAGNASVVFVEDDLATMDLGKQFDVVFSIGVIHHTDDPDRTFENIFRHCKPGGLVIVWCYSAEGNAMVKYGVEPIRKIFLRPLSRRGLVTLSRVITAMLFPIVHTVYRIPVFKFLPYFDYFSNFRRLTFERNVLNVFDKLNAPQTQFITRQRGARWFSPDRFDSATVTQRHYAGVSWSLTGIKASRLDPDLA